MSRATGANGQPAAGDHPGCQLYLITPPAIELDGFAGILAEALDAGPVACVQLRLKDIDDKALKQAADTLREVCHARDVAFIVNDRPDIAAAVGADGAHIGEDDVSLLREGGYAGEAGKVACSMDVAGLTTEKVG